MLFLDAVSYDGITKKIKSNLIQLSCRPAREGSLSERSACVATERVRSECGGVSARVEEEDIR